MERRDIQFDPSLQDSFLKKEDNEAENVTNNVEEPEVEDNPRAKRFARNFRRFLLTGMLALGSGDLSERTPENLEQRLNRAKWEMDTQGITHEQRNAYKPGVSEVIYKTITPYGYNPTAREILKDIKGNITNSDERADHISKEPREDAWRLYLGLPQRYDSFGISEYQPSQSKESKYYYNMPEFFGHYINFLMIRERNTKGSSKLEAAMKKLVAIASFKNTGDADNEAGFEARRDEVFWGMGVMGRFKFSLGQDEKGYFVSYYDKWDLDVPLERENGFVGKPFEIYDRLYYDPVTFKPVEPLTLVGWDFENNQKYSFTGK